MTQEEYNMKKTVYFKVIVDWNKSIHGCDDVIQERDNFIKDNKDNIGKIDSEDLTVRSLPNNILLCILRFTYYEK